MRILNNSISAEWYWNLKKMDWNVTDYNDYPQNSDPLFPPDLFNPDQVLMSLMSVISRMYKVIRIRLDQIDIHLIKFIWMPLSLCQPEWHHTYINQISAQKRMDTSIFGWGHLLDCFYGFFDQWILHPIPHNLDQQIENKPGCWWSNGVGFRLGNQSCQNINTLHWP